jgi:hypothetical protein
MLDCDWSSDVCSSDLALAWNGFWVRPFWAPVVGPVVEQLEVATALPLPTSPALCATDAGALAAWSTFGALGLKPVTNEGAPRSLLSSTPIDGFTFDLRRGPSACVAAFPMSGQVKVMSLADDTALPVSVMPLADAGSPEALRMGLSPTRGLAAWSRGDTLTLSAFDATTLARLVPEVALTAPAGARRLVLEVEPWAQGFVVFGTDATDAGASTWVLRVDADGGALDPAPVTVLPFALETVSAVATSDGLTVAYHRPAPERFPAARTVVLRTLADGRAVGSGCVASWQCVDGECVQGLCRALLADAGADGGTVDAGQAGDAGTGDAGEVGDAGTGDAGAVADAGTGDAGEVADAGSFDAGQSGDAGEPGDAGRVDAGVPITAGSTMREFGLGCGCTSGGAPLMALLGFLLVRFRWRR